MPKKQPGKKPLEDKIPPRDAMHSSEQTTKEMKEKTESEETKPSFQELLSKGKKDTSLIESSPLGSEDELDENIVEVCADVIAIPFAIWHEFNKNVQPLSAKEKENISKPLAKVVAKYDLGKYMKEEFVLVFYLGSAIYGRTKVKKDDKNDNREKRAGEDEPHSAVDPGSTG